MEERDGLHSSAEEQFHGLHLKTAELFLNFLSRNNFSQKITKTTKKELKEHLMPFIQIPIQIRILPHLASAFWYESQPFPLLAHLLTD